MDNSYTANELGEPKQVTLKSINMRTNVVLLIVSILGALAGYFTSAEFVAESFGISVKTAGTIKLVATIVGVVVGAYNGVTAARKLTKE